MSGLEFLTPVADSTEVLARTPMERLAREAGARFERRGGWNVPIAFGGETAERERAQSAVGFADRSMLAKLECNAPAETLAPLGLSPGVAAWRDGAWWCPVTPSRLLVLGEPAEAAALRARVDEIGGRVVELTTGLAALALVGPLCRELLARFCAVDVRPALAPVCAFRPGSVARTPGYVLVEDEDRLLIMVGWALGEYLWRVVADAARSLGGGPLGVDVLARETARA